MISLNDSDGRVTFVRCLYNVLCAQSEEGQDTKDSVKEHNEWVKHQNMKSVYPKDATEEENPKKRPRTGGDGDNAGGGGGSGFVQQLRARAFEIKVIEDDRGIPFEPMV